MDITLLLLLVWCHFLADFVLQSSDIAQNKSKSNFILLKHVSIYSLAFLGFGFVFAIINGALHFITDYVSSRLSGRMWKEGRIHAFFVVIGFDQCVHLSSLMITAKWLLN